MYLQQPNNIVYVLLILFIYFINFLDFIIQQRSSEHFNLPLLLSCNFNNFNHFVTLASTRLRFPEDDADVSNHVGVLTIYKILLIYIHIYIYIYVVHLLVWIINHILTRDTNLMQQSIYYYK